MNIFLWGISIVIGLAAVLIIANGFRAGHVRVFAHTWKPIGKARISPVPIVDPHGDIETDEIKGE